MGKNIFSLLLFVLLFVALAGFASAQEAPRTLSDDPVVKDAVSRLLGNFIVSDSVKLQEQPSQPILLPAVKLNREQYQEGDFFQATLEFPFGTIIPEGLRIGWIIVSMEAGRPSYSISDPIRERSYGQTSRLADFYIETSATGLHVFVGLITDADGNLIAQMNNLFVIGQTISVDRSSYVRIDNACLSGSALYMTGGFVPTRPRKKYVHQQFVLIDGNVFPIRKASISQAVVDLDLSRIRPGTHDITLIVKYPTNASYDTPTTVGGLKLYLRR